MNEPYKLPDGWKWVRLGEVCEIIMGQSPPSSTYTSKPEGIPFFQGKADFGEYYPKVRIWCIKPIKIAEEGDILISVRAPVGPVNMCNIKCSIGRGLAAIRCKDDPVNWYIFWHLKSVEKRIASLGSGSTFGAITLDDLINLQIPLPPLSEQKRIVEKIKTLMDDIEKAKNACKKQIEAAEALFSAYLHQIFESEEAKKWERKKLGEVCEIIKGKKPILYDIPPDKKSLPYLTAEFIRTSKQPQWCLESDKNSVIVNEDEIIIIADGSNSGEIFTGYRGILASTMGKLAIDENKIIKDYIYFFIKMNFNNLNGPKRGSAIPHLEKEIFYNLLIPIPSLETQQRIVNYLKEKFAYMENLKSKINDLKSTIDALPQSILKKAFKGEL